MFPKMPCGLWCVRYLSEPDPKTALEDRSIAGAPLHAQLCGEGTATLDSATTSLGRTDQQDVPARHAQARPATWRGHARGLRLPQHSSSAATEALPHQVVKLATGALKSFCNESVQATFFKFFAEQIGRTPPPDVVFSADSKCRGGKTRAGSIPASGTSFQLQVSSTVTPGARYGIRSY
jgi:hypothetical protein